MSTNRSSLKVHTVPLMYPNKAAERTVILHTAHVTYRPVCDVVFIGGANGVLLPLLELLWEESWSYHECLRAKRESSTPGIRNTPSTDKKHSPTLSLVLHPLLSLSLSPPPPSPRFHNSPQSSQFPSALYMPFTCVSVDAGVFMCAFAH